MASSSSTKHAQAIKLCELCNEDNIQWRCIDCDKCLCQKCQTIHLKVPVTSKHHIISIATPTQDVQKRVVINNIICKDHVTSVNCLYCKTCDCLVCPECVSTSHANHQFIPIEKALDGKMERLKDMRAEVIDSLKTCNSKSTEIQHLVSIYNAIFDDSVTKITQEEQELKERISEYSRVLQKQVEDKRLKVKTTVKKAEQQINGVRKKLESQKEELETALASNQGQVLFDTNLSVPSIDFDNMPHRVENFISKTGSTNNIKELFGSFKEVTIPSVPIKFGFEVLKTFTTDLPVILKVIPIDESSAYLSCYTSNKSIIRKVTIRDKNLKTSNEMSLKIHDMTLTTDNNILLTVDNKSDIKILKKSGKIKSFLTLSLLLPRGIPVSCDNEVMVGVIEPGATYTTSDQSQRAVMVFDIGGKLKHMYQYTKNKERLFTDPYRILTNKNNDHIFVIDRTSEKTGRLLTLNKEGDLRWLYEGHPEFNPQDITTTTENFVVVSGYFTQALHILSENGDVLMVKVMSDIGILYPFGLNIDRNQNLWVGCGSGGKDLGAQLHIVKLMV